MANQALSTQDLRGPAIDYKRYKTRTAKWARGEKLPVGESSKDCIYHSPGLAPGTRRPVQPLSKPTRNGRCYYFVNPNARPVAKFSHWDYQLSASSDDDDVELETPEISPDEGITYSFDAPTGPGKGSHVLTAALTEAVERFEGKQTDKLIKDEYEIVQPESPAAGPSGNPEGSTDADDFELV